MDYDVIATGSTGNALVLNGNILIDCGVSFKALKNVFKTLQIVLLTHIHIDHFNKTTIRKLAEERPTLYFACCEWLVSDLLECNVPKQNIFVMECGKKYDCGAVKLSPIQLYHNVKNCGWRIYIGDKKAVYMTDTGHLEGITAKDYDLYLVESNYTEDDLEERIKTKTAAGEYCYELYVAERHLSHEQISDWLFANMGNHSEYCLLHGHKEKPKSKDWSYED